MIFNMVGKNGQTLLITDTLDANGGTIRTITGKVVKLQTKSITPTTSVQTVNPDTGYDGFSQVTIGAAASGGINNQNKTVSPTTSQQSITYDSGYTGLGTVTVNAMPVMTLPTAVSSTSSGTSKATISRSTSDQYINIPTGYNSAAAYYKISAVADGSVTGPSSLSASSAAVSTGTNTITLTKTGVTTTPTVSAGYVSSATASTATVTLTASVTTKGATTYTPTTTSQTIASDTYLTGAQTISGDANLVAGNIKSGVSIFGVSGSYAGSGSSSVIVTNESNTTGTTAVITADDVTTLTTKSITANGTYTASTDGVDGYSSVTVNVSGGGSVTQDQDGYIVLPSTGGGGGAAQTATGTFTGSGNITQSISCSFVPDLIYVHGDLSSDLSLRGVESVIIIKNTALYVISDGSSSDSQQTLWKTTTNITSYNETNQLNEPYATYSNGTLSFDMVENTSSARFNSSVTYSYKLVKWT